MPMVAAAVDGTRTGGDAGTAALISARLPSLAGLRFAAAFLVFGFHTHVMGLVDTGPLGAVLDWIFGQAAGAFSFFFLLSGFVLTWSLRPAETAARFWRRRLARIYPNHLVTWLGVLGLLVVSGARVSAAVVVSNLLLVQAWLPDPRMYFGMNVVSWSLACEVFFYALFPLLYRLLVRLPAGAVWPATAAALAAIWVVPLAAQALPERYRYWAIWVCPLARLPQFVTGMLLARIVSDGRWPAVLRVWPIAALTAAAYVGSRWLPTDLRLVAGLGVPLALLVGAIAATDANGRRTVWCSPSMLLLSELAYAFYLIHHPVLRVVVRLAGTSHPVLTEVAIAAAGLVLALFGSWLLYRCVERPGRRLLLSAGRRAGPTSTPRAATAPVSRRTGARSTSGRYGPGA